MLPSPLASSNSTRKSVKPRIKPVSALAVKESFFLAAAAAVSLFSSACSMSTSTSALSDARASKRALKSSARTGSDAELTSPPRLLFSLFLGMVVAESVTMDTVNEMNEMNKMDEINLDSRIFGE